MKFLPLIWSGIWRKPGRSILIFLQVSVAFALFGVLQGMKTGVEQVVSRARADLLLVHGNLSIIDSLPVGLLDQIESAPGVKVVIPVELILGRTAVLVRTELAAKYGWKVGERIPLQTAVARADRVLLTTTGAGFGHGSIARDEAGIILGLLAAVRWLVGQSFRIQFSVGRHRAARSDRGAVGVGDGARRRVVGGTACGLGSDHVGTSLNMTGRAATATEVGTNRSAISAI